MQKTIKFFRPLKTVSVRVTGDKCDLNCAHCGGHFLRTMVGIYKAEALCESKQPLSCLISGGCNKAGEVPFKPHVQKIKKLKERYRINIHTGMIEKSDFKEIKGLADVVSFDIPASDDIIRDVYGLDYKTADYIETFKKLYAEIKTVPHLCLGLGDNKHLNNELSIIEKISGQKPEKLCIIIFTPVKSTKFQDKVPPNINAVGEFLVNARKMVPQAELILGCMRPGGKYREEIDSLALDLGIDGIVMPARTVVNKAEQNGFEVIWKEECCAF